MKAAKRMEHIHTVADSDKVRVRDKMFMEQAATLFPGIRDQGRHLRDAESNCLDATEPVTMLIQDNVNNDKRAGIFDYMVPRRWALVARTYTVDALSAATYHNFTITQHRRKRNLAVLIY